MLPGARSAARTAGRGWNVRSLILGRAGDAVLVIGIVTVVTAVAVILRDNAAAAEEVTSAIQKVQENTEVLAQLSEQLDVSMRHLEALSKSLDHTQKALQERRQEAKSEQTQARMHRLYALRDEAKNTMLQIHDNIKSNSERLAKAIASALEQHG